MDKHMKLLIRQNLDMIFPKLGIVFPRLALHYEAYKRLIRNQTSYLYISGWIQSIQESRVIDGGGNPVPWMNYSVIEFLKQRLRSDFAIFEFGSGYSTLFFAERVRSVTSLEHNKGWFLKLKKRAPANVELVFEEADVNGKYCRVIDSTDKLFDVIIIDGKDRVNCLVHALPALSAKGVIVFDDSDRDEYKEGFEILNKKGFRSLDFAGMKPLDDRRYCTRIFYRDDNCFKI